jgi:YCII-related domain
MTKYLVLYKADQSAQQQMAGASPEEAQAGMAAWMEWQQRAGDAIVDMGSPVAPADDTADPSIGGYSIVQADSPEALASVLDGHPHLQIGTLQTHRFLDMPGM